MVSPREERTVVSTNKKAFHDYFVLEVFEAGISLAGTEVKSLRKGKVNLKDSWCNIEKGEIFVCSMHISPYSFGNRFNLDPLRVRKLLMHKKEVSRIYDEVRQQGLTIVPLSVYFYKGRAKLEIGLCKGKKNYDKRESAKQRDAKREIERHSKI